MERYELKQLQQMKRLQLRSLNETEDLTKQLSKAIERNDRVSVEMLLSMRQGPIQELEELEAGVEGYLRSLPWESAVRGGAILRGVPAEEPAEEELCLLVTAYRRKLASVIEMDKRISLRLNGKKSFYNLYHT